MSETVKDTILVMLSAVGVALSMADFEAILNIVSRSLSIITSVIALIALVITKVKAAKADDGKIDADEAKDIASSLIEGLGDVKDAVDGEEKKGDAEDEK